MNKIDSKYLKKIIKEAINDELNKKVLNQHELEMLKKTIEDINEVNLKSIGRRILPYAMTLGAAAGASKNAQAQDYKFTPTDPTGYSAAKASGAEQKTSQDMFGNKDQKKKYIIISVFDTRNNKLKKLSFDNDGREPYMIENEVIRILNNKPGNSGRYIIQGDSIYSDSDADSLSNTASAEKPSASKGSSVSKPSISGDGNYILVPDVKDPSTGMSLSGGDAQTKATQFLRDSGKNHIKTGRATKDGDVWKIQIVSMNENKVTKEVLKKLILEQLEECGIVANSSDEDNSQASAVSIDPDGYEGRMAKGNLFKMAKSASELQSMLQDNENLEPWVQEKIAVAARMIDDVADYMSYEKTRE